MKDFRLDLLCAIGGGKDQLNYDHIRPIAKKRLVLYCFIVSRAMNNNRPDRPRVEVSTYESAVKIKRNLKK